MHLRQKNVTGTYRSERFTLNNAKKKLRDDEVCEQVYLINGERLCKTGKMKERNS